jgi:hypothetical protein
MHRMLFNQPAVLQGTDRQLITLKQVELPSKQRLQRHMHNAKVLQLTLHALESCGAAGTQLLQAYDAGQTPLKSRFSE